MHCLRFHLGSAAFGLYNAAMRGLYIHIPFCRTRCSYCHFVTTDEPSPALRDRFFKAIENEIRQVCGRYGAISFDTLYFGGGTPSSLSVPEIESLGDLVRRAFTFSEHSECSCEFNPGDGDEKKLEALRAIGVNRISLGCQSFRDRILQKLGRRHTVRDIEQTLLTIRRAGISNISFDLMLRLPGQTAEDFRDSVKRCIDLEASQVSLYDLEVHEGTPFGALEASGALELPEEGTHAQMYESAVTLLTGAGYDHYEISNFAKPGSASRHNLIYWHNQEYLGLGPGAFTYLSGVRSQFAASLERYLRKCESADWSCDVEDRLTEEEKETETLAMRLRLAEGADPSSFGRIYPALKDRFLTLFEQGLLESADGKYRLSLRGRGLAEDVFSFLFQKDRSSRDILL